MYKFSQAEIVENLKNGSKWQSDNNAIEREFVLKNFSAAIAFIIQIGFVAEKQNHHPELFNVYNKVKIRLTTHDVDGVSEKDFALAKEIDLIFDL